MFCALSGEAPEQPVVSKKSGNVFERRLIEKYILEHGKCPVTGETLSSEDLLSVQSSKIVRPRPPTATNIPSMLALFQNEWDAVVLETYQLKQQLEQARQELSHTLYQHEAACRVIARLVKERDALQQQLANVQLSAPAPQAASNGASEMEIVPPEESPDTITPQLLERLTHISENLAKGRRKRPAVEGLSSPEDLQRFTEKSANTGLHAASPAGINVVDIHRDQNLIITGGNDKKVVIFDKNAETVVQTLKGHTKKITGVLFHPTRDIVFSCSADKTTRIWNSSNNEYSAAFTIKSDDEVTDIGMQASGDFIATSSLDSTWSFVDIRSGKTLTKVQNDAVKQGYTCVKFHPDGVLLGTGTTDSVMRIWDLKSLDNVASFTGHQGKITSLSFSENGYYLATSATDQTVKIWDLRKLVDLKTIQIEGDVNAVRFDYSGQYLGVGGSDIRVFATKQLGGIAAWDEVVHLKNTGVVSDFKFSKTVDYLASVSHDRNLRIFAA